MYQIEENIPVSPLLKSTLKFVKGRESSNLMVLICLLPKVSGIYYVIMVYRLCCINIMVHLDKASFGFEVTRESCLKVKIY